MATNAPLTAICSAEQSSEAKAQDQDCESRQSDTAQLQAVGEQDDSVLNLKFIESIPEETMNADEKVKFKDWLRNALKRRAGIFVTGKSGSGKSTLLNTIIGEERFKEGKSVKSHCTKEIDAYKFISKGAKFIVWDSPGLQDGTKDERKYLSNLKKTCNGKADLMLYCIDMSQPRAAHEFSSVHTTAVEKITKTLGKDIWKHTLVVLTFANKIEERLRDKLCPESSDSESESDSDSQDHVHQKKQPVAIDEQELKQKFDHTIEEWKKKFQDALKSKAHVSHEIIQNIPVFPAGHRSHPSLPGHEYWFSDFWVEMMLVANKNARANFIVQAKDRMKAVEEAAKADYRSDKFDTPIVLSEKAKNILIPGAVGGTAAVVGASIGATIGAVAIGVISFGSAAGAGLAIGGVVGAGVGIGVGALVSLYKKKEAFKLADGSAENDSD